MPVMVQVRFGGSGVGAAVTLARVGALVGDLDGAVNETRETRITEACL
jgi:hypothetical protein